MSSCIPNWDVPFNDKLLHMTLYVSPSHLEKIVKRESLKPTFKFSKIQQIKNLETAKKWYKRCLNTSVKSIDRHLAATYEILP